jgi:outer membrane protein
MPSWYSAELTDVLIQKYEKRRLVTTLFLLMQLTAPALAESQPEAKNSGWSGAAGVGPIMFPCYTGRKSSQTWLIPLISADYNNVLYIEPLRAGGYAWGSEDQKMGLGVAIEPRLGFQSSDGTRLSGMAKRRNSIEGGPAFDWDFGMAALSLSLFTDLTNSSRGQSARLYLYREVVKSETLKFGVFGGGDWMSKRVSNYFFGVDEVESNSSRPAFHPASSANATAGFDGRYRVGRNHSVLFGAQLTQLGHGVASSPIVETRQSYIGWLGMAWNL